MVQFIRNIILNLFFIFLSIKCCYAQKNDYVWLQGYDSFGGYDTSAGLYFGNPVMDFNYSPVKITDDSLGINFDWTNTSFCDSDGNLLFYTNGICVVNANGDTLENGDSLNWGFWLQYEDPVHGNLGYLTKEGIYALQSLSNTNQYYLIHSQIDSSSYGAGAILCTLLDMSLNNGKGKVIYKNSPLIIDKVNDAFTLTRHANGRYWWIIVQKLNTNCYYRILLDETGPHLVPDSVCAGSTFTSRDFGPMNFSEDGSKLITLGYYAGLNIVDFDRCDGVISNPICIPYPFVADSGWNGEGVATSPNSRYLYVCLSYYLFQYDLWADDIPGSVDTVGHFDGYIAPYATDFFTAQNGPDGKIYISCGSSDSVYNVINNPDERGNSCNLVQHGVYLRALSVGVPSFPNYRLGALTQSQCDSLTGLNEVQRSAKEQILKVFPNPANDITNVDYGFTDWSKGAVSLEITNELGQMVYTQPLPMYSGYHRLDISSFAAGMYNVVIKRGEAVVAVAKLAKQ